MGLFTNLFGADGSMHQVTRTGAMLTDLSAGRTGFVISDSGGTSLVSDSKGQLHQLMRNGSMITDLSTGATSFEV